MRPYTRGKFNPHYKKTEVVPKTLTESFMPEVRNGVSVKLREGEDFESLMKRFKKKYTKSGIQYELKDRMYHLTKMQKKRKKKEQAQRRNFRERMEDENA